MKFEFDCSAVNHCKQKWTFYVSSESGKIVIEDLNIEEQEKPIGCFGHPKTITVLVKGMALDKINTEALIETECVKDISCGQFLADCIENIKSSNNISGKTRGF